MLSLLRARLVLPALRVAFTAPVPSLLSHTSARVPLLIAQRGFASSNVSFEPPPKKKKTTKPTTGRKPADKKASPIRKKTTTSVKAKKTSKTKKVVKAKKPKRKSKPKKVAPKVVLTDELKPPKKSPSVFAIFYGKFRQGVTSPKATPSENSSIMKEAGSVWRSLSEFEKRPFVEEAAAYHDVYTKKHAEWSERIAGNPAALRKINAVRKRYGRRKVHPARQGPPRPVSSFLRYAIETSSGGGPHRLRAAAETWKTLSVLEKKPYLDKSLEELAKWKAAK